MVQWLEQWTFVQIKVGSILSGPTRDEWKPLSVRPAVKSTGEGAATSLVLNHLTN